MMPRAVRPRLQSHLHRGCGTRSRGDSAGAREEPPASAEAQDVQSGLPSAASPVRSKAAMSLKEKLEKLLALGVAAGLRAGLNEAFVNRIRHLPVQVAGGRFEPHHRNRSRCCGHRVDCRSCELPLLQGADQPALLRPGLCLLLLKSVLTNCFEDRFSKVRDWDSFETDFKAKATEYLECAWGH